MNTQTYIAALNTAAKQHEQQYRDAVPDSDEKKFHHKRMNALNKALAEAIAENVPKQVDGNTWLISSRTNSGNVYRIDTTAWTCTCSAGLSRHDCWHVHAAAAAQEAVAGYEREPVKIDADVDYANMDLDTFLDVLGCEKVTA